MSIVRGRERRRHASAFVSALMVVAAVAVVVSGPAAISLAQARPKVVLIVMENEAYSQIIGSSSAPYINSLVAKGKLFTNYSAVTSGSLHNYLAMTSGLTSVRNHSQKNVFEAIDGTGGADTWVSFQESMGGKCGGLSSAVVPGTSVGLYDQDHDPAYQYRSDETCTQHDVPMTTTSFNPAALPSFSFVTPNMCDDMHTFPKGGLGCPAYFGTNTGSSPVRMGDNWLSVVVPKLLAQADVTVVLTWDEASNATQHIVTLEVGAGITSASSNSGSYNHYNLEAGLYSSLGLGTVPATADRPNRCRFPK